MKLKNAIPFLVIAAFGAGLTACGGGSVSTGGAGGGTGGTGATSSLVLQAPQTASAEEFQGGAQQGTSLASTISEFLISSALAQVGETVYLLDATDNSLVAEGTTDGSGQVIFAVSSGDYIVCIGSSDPTSPDATCTDPTTSPLVVDEDQVVVATLGVEGDGVTEPETLVITSTSVEDAEDNIVAFQDPDNANKTLVCHKDKFVISVGTPAAQNGHMAHGDSLVAPGSEDQCGNNDTDDTDTLSTSGDDDSGPGNSGNRGNRGNSGNSGQGNPNA